MNTIRIQSRVSWFVSAIVILLLISPAVAGGPLNAQLATQGARSPFWPPATEKADDKHHRRVEVTFTKWITTYPLMAGITGGDVAGDFVGEVFQRQVSLNGRIIRLEAMYEVQAGDHSFTALIRGGTGETKSGEPASVSGAALLDGVILAGWRTGARVHVEFQTMPAPSPTESGCAGAPAGKTCFQGTIRIERDPKD